MHEHENATVCIIERDTSLITTVTRICEDEGFATVSSCLPEIRENIDRYVEIVKNYNPRVVILGLAYPYELSCEFANQIQAMEESTGICFILMTTNKREVEQRVQQRSGLYIIEMPFDMSDILQALSNCLPNEEDQEPAS